jgi:ferritin
MVAEKLVAALNRQIGLEADSSNAYLAMACWCEGAKLPGCAAFFYAQAEEERGHLLKIVRYLNENGASTTLPAQTAPKSDYASIEEAFQVSLKQEQNVTAAIHAMVEMAHAEKAWPTLHFLQWYVEEQQEEERTFQHLLDRIALIGLEGRGLYLIDKAVSKHMAAQQA